MKEVCVVLKFINPFLVIVPFGTPTGSFPAILNYVVKEEGDEFGYDDSYALEAVNITVGEPIIAFVQIVFHFS